MRMTLLALLVLFLTLSCSYCQENGNLGRSTQDKWFSLGVKNSLSTFDKDGTGLGAGGQFRVQLSDKVNTEWFADFITIGVERKVRSEYYHIGWSVLFYPEQLKHMNIIQGYIAAGHCFDFNKKTVIADPSISKSRWGSAVQGGLGVHFFPEPRFDISVSCQYMIHLTRGIEANLAAPTPELTFESFNTAEGHLLISLGLNYNLFRL